MLDGLAKRLSDPKQIGLNADLAERFGVASEDITRGRLMAESADGRSHLGVYLLGTYVVDDTDFFGAGEIYWWSIPTMLDGEGKVSPSALHGLINGAAPHKCSSRNWMTNLPLEEPPLLAAIPPDESVKSCVIRLGLYDDDGKPADVPRAIGAGLETLAGFRDRTLPAGEVIAPVRDAIFESLRAKQDDVLIDEDVTIGGGATGGLRAGAINSVVSAKGRVYYLVRDEQTTEQFGPISLVKGTSEEVIFDSPLERGGRLAIFTRGANVLCPFFGILSTEVPFMNHSIDERAQKVLSKGLSVEGTGPAELVAYYTPPRA